jgi:DNA-binding NtrC family response regulator
MASILVVDADLDHASALSGALEEHRHQVETCESIDDLLGRLKKFGDFVDVIILVVFSNRPEDWETLDFIPQLTTGDTKRKVLCLSRKYSGPQLRLAAERRGARLVYEQAL